VVIDVIAPPERGRKIDGIRFHRVRPPRLEETGTVDGIPCTSPSRTLVEADSRDFHATNLAFERDRWRDRELLRAGYATLRVTYREAEQEPEAIADAVASALAARLPPALPNSLGGAG